MNKWLLLLVVIVVIAAALLFIFRREAMDLFFDMFVAEPERTEDAGIWQERISLFTGGASVKDRDFLIRKLMALSAAAGETHFARLAYKYYYEDFEKMASDGTLDAAENRALRDLYSEVLPEELVEQWYRERGRLVIGQE